MPKGVNIPERGSVPLTILTTDDLHAYLDDELEAELIPEIEEVVEDDPRAARWLSEYRLQIACMKRAFRDGAENVPDRLVELVRSAKSPA